MVARNPDCEAEIRQSGERKRYPGNPNECFLMRAEKMKIKCCICPLAFFFSIFFNSTLKGQPITTGTLLNEMTDLKRLSEKPDYPYKYIQLSSYDRRSTKVSEPGWFANSDGFGNEPVPGFEKVLKSPDENGTGEYLICDVKGPGAILRLWTARINGKIRLFLDGNSTPLYEGDAQSFFWETAGRLSNGAVSPETDKALRQFDATYFPIPFAKGCRIEWIGDIRKLHFYHIGIRIYDPPCGVLTFNPGDISGCLRQLEEIVRIMHDPDRHWKYDSQKVSQLELEIPKNSRKELFRDNGTHAIEYLSLKTEGSNLRQLLRQNILNIYFDGSPSPQVQSPIGDFFGAAPGINPYRSVPFSVHSDGTMECRFVMPFRDSVRIEIENHSDQDIQLTSGIRIGDYAWKEGESMHFRAKWRISHNLTASNVTISDIPYLMAFGKGRVVGAVSFLLNPASAPASNGNWWGEGDEKIFIDQDRFPSLFGTGSEDYYNYSWSSSRIFSDPYSGQPRNDGPGNRGFVSNYRWHILDDIPFQDRLAFYMELRHHGQVPGFAYGRMVYWYALPDLQDDHVAISKDDLREQILPEWSPVAYRGSEGYTFYSAEDLVVSGSNQHTEKGELWAGGNILMWSPIHKGDQIRFTVPVDKAVRGNRILITCAHLPEGGNVSVYLNGEIVEFNRSTVIDLSEPYHQVLRNHTSMPVSLMKGTNEIMVEYVGEAENKKVGIDFFWIRK